MDAPSKFRVPLRDAADLTPVPGGATEARPAPPHLVESPYAREAAEILARGRQTAAVEASAHERERVQLIRARAERRAATAALLPAAAWAIGGGILGGLILFGWLLRRPDDARRG